MLNIQTRVFFFATLFIFATLTLPATEARQTSENPAVDESAPGKSASEEKKETRAEKKKDSKEGKTLKKNKAVEFLKYFNPVPDKSYKNESQDRVIKKRKFKTVEVEGAEPINNREIGYFAIVPHSSLADQSLIAGLLERDNINGLSATLPWTTLEPKETKYNWEPIDSLLESVKKKDKTLILRISTCGLDKSLPSDTPDWVYSEGTKSIQYRDIDGKMHKMPIFWDAQYLAKWSNFINAFGERYDGNKSLHSVGITGGGILGSTSVIPNFVTVKKLSKSSLKKTEESSADEPAKKGDEKDSKSARKKEAPFVVIELDGEKTKIIAEPSKKNRSKLAKRLKKEFGMSERQLVEHWKYVADIYPKAFKKSRLNFDINAPIPGRAGQSGLDEISDYLVYRYGQRVYLTRQGVADGKHGFNEYRVLLKFHPDTLTGYQLSKSFKMKDLAKLKKNALMDGISFCELPISFVKSSDDELKTTLASIRSHMGYQLVSQKVSLPDGVKVGDPVQATFQFVNLGAAAALKPTRQLDKDLASSYKIQLELRNEKGKPVMRSLHTPDIPTNQWSAGEPIAWEEELKMPKLKPGKYSVFMSLVDSDRKRKLKFLNQVEEGKLVKATDAEVGSITITQ